MDYLDSLTAYANPPYNVLGATLFTSYVVVALYSTTSITASLYRQYSSIKSLKSNGKEDELHMRVQDARKRHIKIYAFLASLSFATLSYLMFGFLTWSYRQWASDKWLVFRTLNMDKLKGWLWDSTLFETFARHLVEDGASTLWTQTAILSTWFWNIWMAAKAEKHGFSAKTMAPYIMLSQILPISFTACLFIIQLHFAALGITPDQSKPESKTEPKKDKAASPPKVYKRTTLTLPTILLNAALLCLPSLRYHAVFMPLVLFTRLILFMPFSGRISLRDEQVVQSISISGGFIVANLAILRKVIGWKDFYAVLTMGKEAPKSLAWDAQIGALVYAALAWGGGV